MKRPGSIEVEILRNRLAIKKWAVERIALTAVFADEEVEASNWFHELPVEDRSRMFVDLARLNFKDFDLSEIAAGPLGELVRRYPDLFNQADLVTPIEVAEESIDEVAEPALS